MRSLNIMFVMRRADQESGKSEYDVRTKWDAPRHRRRAAGKYSAEGHVNGNDIYLPPRRVASVSAVPQVQTNVVRQMGNPVCDLDSEELQRLIHVLDVVKGNSLYSSSGATTVPPAESEADAAVGSEASSFALRRWEGFVPRTIKSQRG